MKASNVRIKMFSACTTPAMETYVNKWLELNPNAEIHKMQLEIQNGVHVMMVYEPAKEVTDENL